MREFEGRVAVVTGAASGIGLGLATAFAREGMKVVLADVEKDALEAAVADLRREELQVRGVLTDVSREEAVDALSRDVFETEGGVHVLCNNAGVGSMGGGPIWEASLKDWQWVFGVNFFGIVNGVKAFLPRMLANGEEGHIVNTASIMGLTPGGSIYGASKHAVVSFSETLFQQLRMVQARVGVSVLCPGHVPTRITSSVRNRPEEMWEASDRPTEDALRQRDREWAERGVGNSLTPDKVADRVIEGIREGTFYILPHKDDTRVRLRFDAIMSRQGPEPTAAPAWLPARQG